MLHLAPFFVRFWLLWCLFGAFFRVVFAKFVANLSRIYRECDITLRFRARPRHPPVFPLIGLLTPPSARLRRRSGVRSWRRTRASGARPSPCCWWSPGGPPRAYRGGAGRGKSGLRHFRRNAPMWRTNPRHPATLFANGQIPNSQIFPLRPLLEFLRSFLLFSFVFFSFICPGFASDFPIFASVLLVVAAFLLRFSSFSKVKLSLLSWSTDCCWFWSSFLAS